MYATVPNAKMLDELQYPTMREWLTIFDCHQETIDSINDSINEMRTVLQKIGVRNKKALIWLKEIETDVNELTQNIKIMKNRVIRLQVELDHMPKTDQSTEEDSEDEELVMG